MSETEETPTPDKMKVAELRSNLAERGLDTKGTKPVLVARLVEALDAEKTPEEKAAEAAAATEKMETEKVEENGEAKVENGDAKEEKKEDGEKKEEKKDGEERGKKRKAEDEPYEVKEDEPEIDDKLICLDWYNSDLHLRIAEDKMSAQPNNKDGWGYIYAGARATYGFTSGKIFFEVKYLENLDTKLDKEDTLFDMRVGWSTDDAVMQLGEDDKSWSYTSATGKMVTNKAFEEYGEKFEKGDIIGAFLDLDGDEISMTFTKNGEDQGDAFQIPKADLGGKALFPHVLAKNVKFEVNFGVSKDAAEPVEAWKEALEGGYVLVGQAAEETRVRGTPRIEKREECEMIMMIGLPASGKTAWVNKLVAESPDKHYNVIGTSTLISKMTVEGEPRKKHHKGKWDQVIQKATRCLQDMLRVAATRRRNIIIDQTNVYPNAQKRKVRPFEGFQRRAVVIVPSDEDYKARAKAQEEAESKDVPESAVMEMKANFALPPAEDTPFSEITFIELDREEADKLVEGYNKDAKEKGYGKKHEQRMKKFNERGAKRGRFQNTRGGPRGRFDNRGGRGRFDQRGRFDGGRGGRFQSRGGRGGPMRGGPMHRGGPMRGGPGGRGKFGGPGGNFGGPSPWSQWQQNQNAPQGWGPWNQGGGAMGGNMGGMGGGNMGGGGGYGNMGGNNRMMGGGGMGNMGGGGGGMGGGNWGGQGGQVKQGNMGGGGGGNQGRWGGNQGGNQGGQGGYNQGYPGSQNWGGGWGR